MTAVVLAKAPTGIQGLDEITEGGLPRGRPTLVCGSAGCGKTVMGLQFLVRGALDHGEPGILVSFEEAADELAQNVASVGWDLEALQADGKLVIDHIRLDPTQIEEAGAYDLEGLFIRLGAAIDEVGAKRVVIDTLEVLFVALKDQSTLRSEIQRLFRWLKQRGITAIITAERGDGTLTRHSLEEYVSDCVILLDHRVDQQVSTRRLRVVKYRGSRHDPDETPFMIDQHGFRVMPMSSLRLEHAAPVERVSTGVERLDAMLDGKGYFRGGSMLITGTPGSGKTSLAASFAQAGCERGERTLFFAYEESPEQLIRNQRSIANDLRPHVDSGVLRIFSSRPAAFGLEAHLASIVHELDDFAPELVVIDPMSAFGGRLPEREAMLTRVIDLLKSRGITLLCTSLVTDPREVAGLGVSSVIDAWINLISDDANGERNRSLSIIKARGTAHSNQIREFVMSERGIELIDVYTAGAQIAMGSERAVREAEVAAARSERADRIGRLRHQRDRRRASLEAQIAALRSEFEHDLDTLEREIRAEEAQEDQRDADAASLASARGSSDE